MNNEIIFKKDNWLFELTIPEYETTTFGGKMSELRLVPKRCLSSPSFALDYIDEYLMTNDILACTFRGKEDTRLVQYLNELGFKFIGTFNTMVCKELEFKEIPMQTDLIVMDGQKRDYDAILEIESRVFDYSSYQLDPLFLNEITAYRNVLRVKSYFNNPNHHSYIIKNEKKVIGFLQFLIDDINKIGKCVNGAVDPDYHGMLVGPKLYSDAFKHIFDSFFMNKIISGCSNQNIPVLKIHRACGFRITDHEIHLRLKI